MCYLPMQGNNSWVIKKNEVLLLHATTKINLENITLSQRGQT